MESHLQFVVAAVCRAGPEVEVIRAIAGGGASECECPKATMCTIKVIAGDSQSAPFYPSRSLRCHEYDFDGVKGMKEQEKKV